MHINEDDYDPLLATRLSAALEMQPLMRHLAPRPRRSRVAPALAVGATLALAAAGGLVFEVNAVAESNGAGCLDALAKINFFARSLQEQFHDASIDQQRVVKARVLDYANGLIAANCQGVEPGLLQKTNNGILPLPSPSAAVGTPKAPGAPYASGGLPKPTNPPPSPSPSARP